MSLHVLVARYGPGVSFLCALGSALGLPIPTMPILILIGGAIANADASGQLGALGIVLALSSAVAGGLLGDLFWFFGGRRYGDRTIRAICRLSLSRDTCVKRTERVFGRWGVRVLLVAKFFPGLSLVSIPIAGAMGVRTRTFIAHDSFGILAWVGVALGVGVVFARELDFVFIEMAEFGRGAFAVVVAVVLGYVGFRFWRRHALSMKLATARISPRELQSLAADDAMPTVFDIRSEERRVLEPFFIPGCVFADERDLQVISEKFPHDEKIVICCSCPNEVSAAWMAKSLNEMGFKDVLPLSGGLDAWRAAGLELQPLALADAAQSIEHRAAI